MTGPTTEVERWREALRIAGEQQDALAARLEAVSGINPEPDAWIEVYRESEAHDLLPDGMEPRNEGWRAVIVRARGDMAFIGRGDTVIDALVALAENAKGRRHGETG